MEWDFNVSENKRGFVFAPLAGYYVTAVRMFGHIVRVHMAE